MDDGKPEIETSADVEFSANIDLPSQPIVPTKIKTNQKTGLPRFGLPQLFYVTAVIAAAVAFLGVWGVAWAGTVFLFWYAVISDANRKQKLDADKLACRSKPQAGLTAVEILVVIAIIGILIGMFLPAVSRYSPQAAARYQNRNSMRQLVLALHNYQSDHGHLPPAYVADADGKPMHSWRVLMLPYLDHQDIYDQYDFDEPWDGPNNSKLAEMLDGFSVFHDNYGPNQNRSETKFKLVTGPNTVFDEDRSIDFGDVAAGAFNTIVLVNDTVHPVCWMAPEDITVAQTVDLFDRKKSPDAMAHQKETKFSITTSYYSTVGFLDGHVESVGTLDDPAEIRDHLTITTPPAVLFEDLDFQFRNRKKQTKPEGYFLLAINAVLAVLPAFWVRRAKA